MLEGLLAKPGLIRPKTQKAFLYVCWRQAFLEHVENRESRLFVLYPMPDGPSHCLLFAFFLFFSDIQVMTCAQGNPRKRSTCCRND